eukprot:878157-Prorocentrum_minimum.AAC.8
MFTSSPIPPPLGPSLEPPPGAPPLGPPVGSLSLGPLLGTPCPYPHLDPLRRSPGTQRRPRTSI